jgi:DNA repair protein SbcC/Rad50
LQEIDNWLLAYNKENEQKFNLEKLLEINNTDITTLTNARTILEELNNKKLTLQGALKQLMADAKKHASNVAATTLSLLEIDNILITNNKNKETLDDVLLKLNTRQHNHNENTAKHKSILNSLKELQSNASQWATLNELFGSATGDTFSKIAQQFTLDTLVEYANMHLQYIAPRYGLQRIPDKLSLQIVDYDMADEVRTVYSLSGGETFLVSLALALALSTISSHTIQTSNLFIDEGFGALDESTLQTAMYALQKLQDQGRKIGIITHVQTMKENIPVQIEVIKNGAGKSSIAING